MSLTKDELKWRTRKYWDVKDWSKEDEDKMQRYVRVLLRGELAYRQYLPAEITSDPNESAKAKITCDIKCDILVIMLGHSFEPLLQAIVAYQPKQILMVLNKKYDDERDGEMPGVRYYESTFESAFELLKENQLLASDKPTMLPGPMDEAGGSPVEIFRFLRQNLLTPINEKKRVVIDITGAKKSMVAGAYLFAAFADVPVSYVDFETYSPKEGKPYGYTCIIEEIESPAKTFRLRDWERVRQLYEHYAFRTARELLNDELIPAMTDWFEVNEIEAAKNLVKALHIYQLWDEGNFSVAYQELERSGLTSLPLPTAITELGANNYWAQGQTIAALQQEVNALQLGQNGDLNTSLYLQHEKLSVYADDELAKIERLREKSEDHRSALLRAAGLSELLLKARLFKLWMEDLLLFNGLKRSQISDKREAEKRLTKAVTVYEMGEILRGQKITLQSRPALTLNLDSGTSCTNIFGGMLLLTPLELAGLRNKAIHFCIPVSADLAKQSYESAEANLTDFKTWAATFGLSTSTDIKTHVTWQELSNAIALNFLPNK
jgi:hypothetical protein